MWVPSLIMGAKGNSRGRGIGDEPAGLMRLGDLLLQIVEEKLRCFSGFRIVAASGGEIALQLSYAIFHRKGIEPASANLGSCGSSVCAIAISFAAVA